MIFAGTEQARVAADMLTLTGAVLTGPITAIEYRANLAARTGATAAMGISMPAGSVEDGGDWGPGKFSGRRQPTRRLFAFSSDLIIARSMSDVVHCDYFPTER